MNLNIYILSVERSGYFCGVDRHIEILMNAFQHISYINCIYLAFIADPDNIQIKEETISANCKKIRIPLPYRDIQILNNAQKLESYANEAARILRPYIINRKNRILHVHTINLMRVALCIKKRYKSKIIMHLHCIPWKFKLDNNDGEFDFLYRRTSRNITAGTSLICIEGELQAYRDSDYIICVTRNAKQFIHYVSNYCTNNIAVIPNGIKDTYDVNKKRRDIEKIKCIFVGTEKRSKGLSFLLEAIQKLPKSLRKQFELYIIGNFSPDSQKEIKSKFSLLEIVFTGLLSYETLENHYNTAHFGVIPSLHEQCSYTAIEMMMHKVPVICSDIDGLHEMFEHEKTALTVPLCFTNESGLTLNVQILTNRIKTLIEPVG